MLGKHIVRWDIHCEHCNNELINSSLTDQWKEDWTKIQAKKQNVRWDKHWNCCYTIIYLWVFGVFGMSDITVIVSIFFSKKTNKQQQQQQSTNN